MTQVVLWWCLAWVDVEVVGLVYADVVDLGVSR